MTKEEAKELWRLLDLMLDSEAVELATNMENRDAVREVQGLVEEVFGVKPLQ